MNIIVGKTPEVDTGPFIGQTIHVATPEVSSGGLLLVQEAPIALVGLMRHKQEVATSLRIPTEDEVKEYGTNVDAIADAYEHMLAEYANTANEMHVDEFEEYLFKAAGLFFGDESNGVIQLNCRDGGDESLLDRIAEATEAVEARLDVDGDEAEQPSTGFYL